jgi:hypothetical protein
MFSMRNILIGLLVVALAILGYWGFATWQKRSQHKAIADTVAEGTAQLRAALLAPPSAQNIAGIEAAIERLQATRASRQIAFAGAADAYLAAARTIMLRRADVERIAPHATASRQALADHMNTPRGRNDDWIRRAAELKKKMDADQADLDRVLKTLAELIAGLPESEKPLAGFIDPSYILDEAQRAAALKRVQADTKRNADEVARIGSLPGR